MSTEKHFFSLKNNKRGRKIKGIDTANAQNWEGEKKTAAKKAAEIAQKKIEGKKMVKINERTWIYK